MGWVHPWVGLGWVGLGWVGSHFLWNATGWVGLGSNIKMFEKQMEFLPTASSEDVRFRRNLMSDLDTWMMQEFQQVESNLTSSGIVPDQPDSIDRFAMF